MKAVNEGELILHLLGGTNFALGWGATCAIWVPSSDALLDLFLKALRRFGSVSGE
jgi:hypothetical protein